MNNSILLKIIEQSNSRPNATALKFGEQILTYSELTGKAATLSDTLIANGVMSKSLVPIVSSGGFDYVISLLAVWMTGSAFVPIDEDLPENRLESMIESVGSKIVLSTSWTNSNYNVQNVRGDELYQKDFFPPADIDDGELSYGFFTSGTTGMPKCCLNSHSGLANRFNVMSSTFALQNSEAVLQNSKHTFDSSLWQLLWPLTLGAIVIIPNREGILDIEATLRIIEQENIVMTDFVPSVLNVYVQYLRSISTEKSAFNSFRNILVGGEEVTPKLINSIHLLCPWINITNTYGPTEASIGFVFHHFDKTEIDEIPLGKAIKNTEYRLLDEQLNVIKSSETIGQIAVLGHGVGLGYLGLPELTTEKFLTTGDNKYYLTGDLGSVKNGLLYFHGRQDNQIQLNGVRLELSEVEEAIEGIDLIDCAKVIMKENNSAKYLIAFVTSSQKIQMESAKHHLRDVLPKEFIPKRLIQLDEFPRTASGKIDRNALAQFNDALNFESKVNKELIKLVGSYCEGITVTEKSRLEELGIDSINMILLTIELEKFFNIRITLSQLVGYESLRCLNDAILKGKADPDDSMAKMKSKQTLKNKAITFVYRPSIFLTGATGYFGIHLLNELIADSSLNIVCLVRAEDIKKAEQRLRDTAKYYQLEKSIPWERVEVVMGDVSKSMLGMNDFDYERVAKKTSSILHAAADVNFLKDSDALYSTNAKGVEEMCHFALHSKARKFHYVSSLAVQHINNTNEDSSENGYANTKFKGEKIVSCLTKYDVDVSISRVGELMPSEKYNVPNPNSMLTSTINVFKNLNMMIHDLGSIFYTPIDIAASGIASIFHNQLLSNQKTDMYSLFPPFTIELNHILKSIATKDGFLETVPAKEIIDCLTSKSAPRKLNRDEAIVLNNLIDFELSEEKYLFDSSYSNEEQKLEPLMNYWPSIDKGYLQRTLSGISI